MQNKLNQFKRQEHQRCVQKNQIFIHTSEALFADQNKLQSQNFFGSFGNIQKMIVNKKTCQKQEKQQTFSVYITFKDSSQSSLSILTLRNLKQKFPDMKVNFGMTKYCQYFLENKKCQNNSCIYIHDNNDVNIISQEKLGKSMDVNEEILIKEVLKKIKIEELTKKLKDSKMDSILLEGFKKVLKQLKAYNRKEKKSQLSSSKKVKQLTTWDNEEVVMDIQKKSSISTNSNSRKLSNVFEQSNSINQDQEMNFSGFAQNNKLRIKRFKSTSGNSYDETFMSKETNQKILDKSQNCPYIDQIKNLLENNQENSYLEQIILNRISKNFKLRLQSRLITKKTNNQAFNYL